MTLGQNIKRIRKRKNWNQTRLANEIGISVTSICQIENGKTQPHMSTISALCEKLEISKPLLLLMSVSYEDIPDRKKHHWEGLEPVLQTIFKQLTD